MLIFLIACTKPEDTAPEKVTGPELSHTPPSGALDGQPLTFDVTATDVNGVSEVTLFYRREDLRSYDELALANTSGDDWSVELPGELVQYPGLDYYFRAVDGGTIGGTSYLPADFNSSPFAVDVGVTGVPFPFTEDFETGDIGDTGWANASQGFVGYGWAASATTAHTGTYSAFHSRGIDDIDPLDDWLITPPLDLSTTGEAQVVWYEYGATTSKANHGLYISTGSRDPADGDYVAVAEVLPAPLNGEWGRSAIYDLSAWAGAPTAYLAWRAQGADADDWYVDDVRVEELSADLSGGLSVTPDPIHPGESGTLTWTLTNATTVEAEDVVVSVAFPEGGATVAETSVDVGAVSGGATATADFSLTVDASAIDNSRIPVEITVVSGADTIVNEAELTIGSASTASVGWFASDAGTIELVVGYGDPDAPTWEATVFSGAVSAGAQTFTLDVTDQVAALPPAAGPNRWFLTVDSDNSGAVTDFSVSFGGAAYTATVLPEVLADEDVTVWLPEPPSLDLYTSTTVPTPLSPGASGALDLTVINRGADTSAAVTATLTSTDPDLTIVDGGPVSLTADVLGSGAMASLSSAFAYDVAATHVDSSDLAATLTLTDGVDTWEAPVALAVPWPVIIATAIGIDDDGGDDVLDPDEGAEFDLSLTNVGALSTDGSVYGTMTATTTGSAVLTVDPSEHRIGALSSGGTERESGWAIDVAGGAPGDLIDVTLDLYDSSRTYTTTFQIELGAPPWQSMNSLDDDVGDALDGTSDMLRGSYRVYNDALQLRVQYADAVDPSKLFLEFWGLSPGGDYGYYNAVFQSNTVYLRGYDSSFGFETLPDPLGVVVDDRTIELDIALADLGLSYDGMSLGFGSGWCGAPEYYCDHMPNDWGYPYDGLYTSYWYDLTW